jgi:hypothetical protein
MGIVHLRPLAEEGVGFVEEQDCIRVFCGAEDSPMYLFTTRDRSILYRSRPSSLAMTSAAIVLPVPEPPEKSAVAPRPRESLRAKPQ